MRTTVDVKENEQKDLWCVKRQCEQNIPDFTNERHPMRLVIPSTPVRALPINSVGFVTHTTIQRWRIIRRIAL